MLLTAFVLFDLGVYSILVFGGRLLFVLYGIHPVSAVFAVHREHVSGSSPPPASLYLFSLSPLSIAWPCSVSQHDDEQWPAI